MALPLVPILPLVVLWLVLARADASSWVIGVPFILLALLVIARGRSRGSDTQPATRFVNPLAVLRFIGYFLIESLRGGIDVVRIVLSANPSLSPGFFDYRMSLQDASARQIFISSISLLPGTLSADWNGNEARIHALDFNSASSDGIRQLEQKIANIFGETLC